MLKAMSIHAASRIVNVGLNIVRGKIVAVLLGASGVGVLGTLTNVTGLAVTVSTLGLHDSAVRALGASADRPEAVAAIRRAMLFGNVAQGLAAGALLVLLREPVALWVFGDASRGGDIVWCAVAVVVSMLAGAQLSVLQGLRRARDLALCIVFSGLLGTVAALGVLAVLGAEALLWLLILPHLASTAVGLVIARRSLPALARVPASGAVWKCWRALVGVGTLLMVSTLAAVAAQLAVRSFVLRDLGLASAGHLHAALTISTQYAGFILFSMATDYFPRLSGIIDDTAISHGLVDEQTQVGLAVGVPIMLGLIGIAPWAVPILFSTEFMPAVSLLQWLCLGSVVLMVAFPLSFVPMAQGRSATYLAVGVLQSAVLIVTTWVLLPVFGLVSVGMAVVAANATQLVCLMVLLRFRWGYLPRRRTAVASFAASAATAAALGSTAFGDFTALGVAVAFAGTAAVVSGRFIGERLRPDSKPGIWLRRGFAWVGWPIRGGVRG